MHTLIFYFFCGGRGLNPRPIYIMYCPI